MARVVSRRPPPWEPGIDPRSVCVRSAVDNVAFGQVLHPVLRFPLSVSFHACYILICRPRCIILAIDSVVKRHLRREFETCKL